MGTVGMLLSIGASCLPLSLAAQEQDPRTVVSPARYGAASSPLEEIVVWSFDLRLSALRGDFDSSDEPAKWDEFFKDGIGFGLDWAWWMPVSRRVHAGPYASLSFDMFQGQELRDEDPAGDEILEFDDLMTTRLVVGAGARQTFGRVYLEQRLGGGAGYYFDSEFEFRDPGTRVSGDFIDASMVFTMEARFRVGIDVGGGLDFNMGLGYELMGQPDRADDARDFIFDSSFRRKETTVITVGLSARF